MPPQELRTNDQKLADSAQHSRDQMWRAAETVRGSVADPAAQQELLECLGLLDLNNP